MTPIRALLALLALPAALSAQSALSDPPAALAPGDLVRLAVWRRPEFSGDFVVAPDSTITHPLLHEVRVAGVPFPVVEARVREFLRRFDANPAFVVSPLLRVFVGGEVRQPNVYSVPPGTSVVQAVALAGGPTERGELEKVLLVRHQQRETFDLTLPDAPAATLELRSGDQLMVNRKRNLFSDVVVPVGSLVGAVAAVANIFLHH